MNNQLWYIQCNATIQHTHTQKKELSRQKEKWRKGKHILQNERQAEKSTYCWITFKCILEKEYLRILEKSSGF